MNPKRAKFVPFMQPSRFSGWQLFSINQPSSEDHGAGSPHRGDLFPFRDLFFDTLKRIEDRTRLEVVVWSR